jgi:hypothetical protein
MEKLFELKPIISLQLGTSKIYQSPHFREFNDAYIALLNEETAAAVEGKKSAAQPAANIQIRGQELLEKYKL